jgi:hypothetical protein
MQKCIVEISPRTPAILIEIFVVFLSPSRDVLQLFLDYKPQVLLSRSTPFYYFAVILFSNTIGNPINELCACLSVS